MSKPKNVLLGIPKMRYGDPSVACFIGSVTRLVEYLGDPIEQDELFTLSGAGLCFPWQYKSSCDEISIIPEIPRRTFAALGYESEYYYEPDISAGARAYSKAFYIEKIKRSIDSGRPVIGFGITAQVFACLITGYYNSGESLYLRSFWPPEGSSEGNDDDENYYCIDNWYDKCHGIVVAGEKTGERLVGEKAYAHIRESAKIFSEMTSVTAAEWIYSKPAGALQTVYTGPSAFEAMIEWLRDDSIWDASQGEEGLGSCEVFLKPCGILLLIYYRNSLREYLGKLDRACPGVVNPAVLSAIRRMSGLVHGKEGSDWDLGKAADPRLEGFENMCDPALREKVAACVERIAAIDREVFDGLIGA